MQINDLVYGHFSIKESVLQELILSPPVQRLKGISQYSLPPEFYHRPGFTRYDHCVGVMLLLRRLNAPLKEQVAGLLHDVSHTAFSHMMDRVMGMMYEENFQDSIHEQMILRTVLPEILTKHGFAVDEVVNYEHFPLLERDKPNLCADRVDYGLREFQAWVNPNIVPGCVADLRNYESEIVFATQVSAKLFGENFARCHRENWGGVETALRSRLFAGCLKYALEQRIIEMNDFLEKDDAGMIEKLSASGDQHVLKTFSLLREKFEYVIDTENPDFIEKKKLRYVDPKFLEEGKIYRLSEVDHSYKQLIEELKKESAEGMKIRLLRPDCQDYSHQ